MKQSKWFAVYTRPNREKQVADSFLKKGIQSYCPENKIHVQLNGRKKIVSEPLFTSNVFVYLDEAQYDSVMETRGVINFLYWHGQPAVIKDEEINAIKSFLEDYPHIELERTPVNTKDSYQVITSPLMQRKGNVLEVLNSTVKLMLPSLGRVLVSQLRKENTADIVYRELFRVRV